ncbi:MAG: hypothetical protein GXP49_13420 [Deltaproteobacteria bacterium]|nr:hypothetical protein [Deltaproteobacteria bacterium]
MLSGRCSLVLKSVFFVVLLGSWPVMAAKTGDPQAASKKAISEGLEICQMGDHQAGLDSIEKGILILKSANLPIPGPAESLPEYKKCLGIWARRLEQRCQRHGGKGDIETITTLLNRVSTIQNPVDPVSRTPIPDILGNALGNCVIKYAMFLSGEAKADPAGALGPVNDLIKIEFYLENLKSKKGKEAASLAQAALYQGKVNAIKAGMDYGLSLCKKRKKALGRSSVERYLLYLDMVGYNDPVYKRRVMKIMDKRCK